MAQRPSKNTFDDWVCPACLGDLERTIDALLCANCNKEYQLRKGLVDFLGRANPERNKLEQPEGLLMVKAYRGGAKLLRWARQWISSEYFPGKAWKQAKARALQAKGQILIIGSGVTRYEGALHLDLDDFPNVDLIADAHHLPFRDHSLGAVLCEVVLEHVSDPERVISEAFRVLRPQGVLFFIVPFVFPFHGHPCDYQRWTREGLREAFRCGAEIEVGIHGGPCSGMVNLLSEWAYILTGLKYPLGYLPIKGLATMLLLPLKWLDLFVVRSPEAHRLASTLYVLATKKTLP